MFHFKSTMFLWIFYVELHLKIFNHMYKNSHTTQNIAFENPLFHH